MSYIIASWSPVKGYSGSTSNLLGVSSMMAIEEADYSLLMDINSTSLTANTLKGKESDEVTYDSGIVSLKRLVKSGLLTPDRLTDCTDIVYKKRLDFLPNDKLGMSKEEIYRMNQVILNVSLGVYDLIWVDANSGQDDKGTLDVLNKSDLVLVNLPQDKNAVEYFFSQDGFPEVLRDKNYMIIVGRYDADINFRDKHIRKLSKEKRGVYPVPYNAEYQNAVNSKKVFEFFYKSIQEQKNKETIKYVNSLRKIKDAVKKEMAKPKELEGERLIVKKDDTDEKDE